MEQYNIAFTIAIVALVLILVLLIIIAILFNKNSDLTLETENLRLEVQDVKNELRFQKTVSKTFKDGIDALTKKNK